jgi:hypothetical protein
MSDLTPRLVMIHHSATEDSGTVSWGAIRRYHMSWKHEGKIVDEQAAQVMKAEGIPVEPPWKDIGYHYGIELVATTSGYESYEIMKGRSLCVAGAHCPQMNMNHEAVGVCLVGNYDEQVPTLAMLRQLRLLCDDLRQLIPALEGFIFHRDAAPWKSCPGVRITKELIDEHVWRR